MLYPACWGISESGNIIAPNLDFIFYGILDTCLIPITSAFFLAAYWRIDPARLGVAMRGYDNPIPVRGGSGLAGEKMAAAATNGDEGGLLNEGQNGNGPAASV